MLALTVLFEYGMSFVTACVGGVSTQCKPTRFLLSMASDLFLHFGEVCQPSAIPNGSVRVWPATAYCVSAEYVRPMQAHTETSD